MGQHEPGPPTRRVQWRQPSHQFLAGGMTRGRPTLRVVNEARSLRISVGGLMFKRNSIKPARAAHLSLRNPSARIAGTLSPRWRPCIQ